MKLKRILEAQLRSVQKQLQVLDNARKRLKAVLSERNKVLDLICHAVSSVRASSGMRDTNASGKTLADKTQGADPLSPHTPEVSEAIALAADARQRSVILRKEVIEAIDQTTKLQKAAYRSVNDGLTKKIAETTTMKVCILRDFPIFIDSIRKILESVMFKPYVKFLEEEEKERYKRAFLEFKII